MSFYAPLVRHMDRAAKCSSGGGHGKSAHILLAGQIRRNGSPGLRPACHALWAAERTYKSGHPPGWHCREARRGILARLRPGSLAGPSGLCPKSALAFILPGSCAGILLAAPSLGGRSGIALTRLGAARGSCAIYARNARRLTTMIPNRNTRPTIRSGNERSGIRERMVGNSSLESHPLTDSLTIHSFN